MNVPLDRLYNFLHDVCDRDDIIIYRFFPHGSRKITDLLPIYGCIEKSKNRHVLCHDQEPLNFDAYQEYNVAKDFLQWKNITLSCPEQQKKFTEFYSTLNLRMAVPHPYYEKNLILLVHSEKNSDNLARYEKELGMVGVYWWSHALIARDWFRYANCDMSLDKRAPTTDFLVYNRAWSGTREYRLKFLELLVNNQLVNNCNISFNPHDGDEFYQEHQFKNKNFSICSSNLEKIFRLNTAAASASADYNVTDYQSTQLEVVLETLFDDTRIQLTEKILRPIACGHPFILASTPGSLKYLQEYGFKTFGQYINEEYDSIQDPLNRLTAITNELRRIASLPSEEKEELYYNLRLIAKENKKLFFSEDWHNKIIQEYKDNLISALSVDGKFIVDLRELRDCY